MKRLISLLACLCVAATAFFCGCFNLGGDSEKGRDGRDGADGQDVSVYDLYEAAKTVEGNENLTLDEFLKSYLSYTDGELSELVNKQKLINRSLMSGCSILTRFSYNTGARYKVYMGSGVFLWVDKAAGDAYVVTNCHVIYDDTSRETFAADVRLYLYGQDVSGINYVYDTSGNITGDEYYAIPATVVAASVTYDIALLKVSGSSVVKNNDILTASFCASDDVHVGEFVYAVGNASGEGVSAAQGIISKDSEYIDLNLSDRNQSASKSYRVIRTTAAINHGNSGGGLFNSSGELVAIVNSKDDDSDIDNMGYALPASNVKRLLKLMYDNYADNGGKMLPNGGIKRPMLNIETSITDSYAVYDNETGLAEIYERVEISDITGAPAKNNLKIGDEITGVKIIGSDGKVKEDKKVTRRHHIADVMLSARQNDTVIVTVKRTDSDSGVTEYKITIAFDSPNYFYFYV